MSGKRMAKCMNVVSFIPQASLLHGKLNGMLNTSAMHLYPLGFPFKQPGYRSLLTEVITKRVQRSRRQYSITIFTTFTLYNFNAHIDTINVCDLQIAALAQANAAAIKQLYYSCLFKATNGT